MLLKRTTAKHTPKGQFYFESYQKAEIRSYFVCSHTFFYRIQFQGIPIQLAEIQPTKIHSEVFVQSQSTICFFVLFQTPPNTRAMTLPQVDEHSHSVRFFVNYMIFHCFMFQMTKTPNGKGDLAPPLHLTPVLHPARRLGHLETTSDDSQRKGKSS